MAHEPPTSCTPRAAVPPTELVEERRRLDRFASDVDRRARRGRIRRRALLPAAVASGVLAGTGLLSGWARETTPSPSVARAPAAATKPSASDLAALKQLEQALNADRSAIQALPQSLGATASATTPGSPAGPQAAGPGTSATAGAGASPVPALPPISVPVISPVSVTSAALAPATHGTTGASGIP